MTMNMRAPLLHQARPALSMNTQPAGTPTGLRSSARARHVAIAVGLLGRALHAMAAETLRARLRAGNVVACRKAVVGAASSGVAHAPVFEGARVAVGDQVRVAALIFPGFGAGAGFDGDGAGAGSAR